MMHACKPWRAAVLAAPRLIPFPQLSLPALQAPYGELMRDSEVVQLRHHDMVQGERALAAAVALHPLTYRVRFQGAGDNEQVRSRAAKDLGTSCMPRPLISHPAAPLQSVLLNAIAAVLPRGIHELHLECNCKGLYLPQLRRFPNLQQLVITSNTAFAFWHGAAPVMRTLRGGLLLDCRSRPVGPQDFDVDLPDLPAGVAEALAAATCVTSLEFISYWAEATASVAMALRNLRHLKRVKQRRCVLHARPRLHTHARSTPSCSPSLCLQAHSSLL